MFSNFDSMTRKERLRARRKAVAEREIFVTDSRRPSLTTLSDVATIRNRFGHIVREGADDVLKRYSRSVFGPLWNMISTIVFVLGFMVLGKLLLNIPSSEFREYVVYVTGGVVFWSFIFSLIVEGANLYTSPTAQSTGFHLSFAEMPVRMVVRNVVLLAFNLITLVVVSLLFAQPSFIIALFIPGVILTVLALVPVGVVLGIVAARYRDISPAVANLMQFGFYLSPVFWRASDIPETYPERLFLELNPFYYLLTVMRDPIMGDVPGIKIYLVLFGMIFIGWVIAIWAFAKYRRKIIYWA